VRRSFLPVGSVVAGSLLVLGTSLGQAAASVPATTKVPAGATATPVPGGNLVIARQSDSQSMNNTTVFDNESIWVFEQMFQPLYTVDSNGKGVHPWLATGYKMSANKLDYTFTLRQGVKFSNGKPMTSADVKFSIDKSAAAAQGWGYIDSAIKDVLAPSPYTVVIQLKHPWAPLLADLSLFSNDIVPANYGGQTEAAFYQHPIGTGPFKWDTWVKGSKLTMVKNPYYWQKGLPYLNSVTWTDVPDSNTRQLQLQGGQAQIDEFPAWSTVQALKSTPNVTMNLFNSTRTDYVIMNEEKKPFNDVHVRRAISYAIDRAALVKAVLYGNGKPANSFMPPAVPYYDPASPGLQYDMTKATQEMAESSVPKGFSTTLLIPSGDADYLTVAQILQSELAKLHITVNIQQLDPNTVNTDQQKLEYEMSISYWTMDIPDPDELATFAVVPSSGAKSFFTDYDNKTVVADVAAAEANSAPAARTRLYDAIQSQAAADAFMGFLYYSPYAYATSTKVHNFFVTPLGNYPLADVWISK
jgi:peptide/nickel transport system substrate-binding protein